MRIPRMKNVAGFIIAILVSGVWLSFTQTAPDTELTSAVLLQYLNQTVDWYRQLDFQRQIVTGAEEGLILSDNQQIANQVVSLAFEFARSQADSIEKEEASGQAGNRGETGSSRYQSLRRMLSSLDQQVRASQVELESLRRNLATETGRQRESIQLRMDETRSELELAQVRRDAMRSMAEFVTGSSTGGLGATGIREKIEALARSVPAALAKPATKQETPASAAEQITPATAPDLRRIEPSGVWGLTMEVISVSRRVRTLREANRQTDALSQDLKGLRTPLVTTLKELSKRGDELAAQSDTTSDQIGLIQQKAMLDALTAQFKRTWDTVSPLSKQGILLALYQKNLTDWLASLESRYAAQLRNLLVRLAILVAILTGIIGGAELWRRAILQYVRDPRRRYQYLLLRKIVFWCVIAVVLMFSFANELSSVATFAGLITAGVAVSLQSVILSVVAYFFLIGRYGIRVGDRVQVAGITGEVVDIGLVRFHLLELVSGAEKTATGRVVAFSNSIVFQSNAGFFKQIPGTSFVWHEITLAVSPGSDYQLAEERAREVVETVFAEYRDEMEKQYRHIQRILTTAPEGALRPTSRLHPTTSGLEVIIRYPVDLVHASEMDDRVTRELLSLIDREPKLKPPGSDKPPLRLNTGNPE